MILKLVHLLKNKTLEIVLLTLELLRKSETYITRCKYPVIFNTSVLVLHLATDERKNLLFFL